MRTGRQGPDALVCAASELQRHGHDGVARNPEHDCATLQLGLVPLRAYVPATHPWAVANRDMVKLAELATQPLLVPRRASVSCLELDLAMTLESLAQRLKDYLHTTY